MTIIDVGGHGRQKGQTEIYRGMEYNVDLLPKLKVELVVRDSRCDDIVSALARGPDGKDSGREDFSVQCP